MSKIAARVLHRHLLRASGFVEAESAEAPASATVAQKTKTLLEEVHGLLPKAADPALRKVVNDLSEATQRVNIRQPGTMGFERDLQFLLLLIIKELSRKELNHAALVSVTRRLDALLIEQSKA